MTAAIAVAGALCTGFVVGVVFALVGLPPPAPASWAGLAGIVGIVVGWHLIARWVGCCD